MQLVPLPRMKPRQPSSFHIFFKAPPTESWYSWRPADWIWKRIFRRSRGDTTVRETAPATPPAQKAATTGCEMNLKTLSTAVLGRTGEGRLLGDFTDALAMLTAGAACWEQWYRGHHLSEAASKEKGDRDSQWPSCRLLRGRAGMLAKTTNCNSKRETEGAVLREDDRERIWLTISVRITGTLG